VRKAIVEYLEQVDMLNTRLSNEKGAYTAMMQGRRRFVEEVRVRYAAEQLMKALRRLRMQSTRKPGSVKEVW